MASFKCLTFAVNISINNSLSQRTMMLVEPYYILIGKNPVSIPRSQFLQWGHWFERQCRLGGRHIGQINIPPRKPFRKGNPKMLRKINRMREESILVSTVFLGLDHNYFGGRPILFETMIFGGNRDQYQERYHTWDEAKIGHDYAVTLAKKGMVL